MADPRVHSARNVGKTKGNISTSHAVQAAGNIRQVLDPTALISTRVGAGMRSFVSLSKALGLGGKLPFDITKIDNNTRWVFDQLGINGNTVMQLMSSNPSLATAGTSNAATIFNKIVGGIFGQKDVKIHTAPMINLAKACYAHEFKPAEHMASFNDRILQVSPYAMDLLRYAPKFKFLFVVQITFSDAYADVDHNFQKEFAFVIKKASRPEIKYHTEDVNYYNHRTKVITKAEWDPISMTFYDDGRNNAATFHSLYTRALSPVMNYANATHMMGAEAEGITGSSAFRPEQIGNAGAVPILSQYNSASTGILANDAKTLISEIKVYHVFDNGKYANIYNFINPRITSLALDDLDMSANEVGALDIKFEYDTVYTELKQPLQNLHLEDLTSAGQYPLRYVGGPSQQASDNYQQDRRYIEPTTPALDQTRVMATMELQKAQKLQRSPVGMNDNFFSKYKTEITAASNLLAGAFNKFGVLK